MNKYLIANRTPADFEVSACTSDYHIIESDTEVNAYKNFKKLYGDGYSSVVVIAEKVNGVVKVFDEDCIYSEIVKLENE